MIKRQRIHTRVLKREREKMNAVNDKREKEINLSVLYLDIIYVLNIQNKKKKIL
jgi:hypothetical protein